MMMCDNGRKAYLGAPIVAPACFGDEATVHVDIIYHDGPIGGSDSLRLCRKCAKVIKADARKHGYCVEAHSLRRQRKEAGRWNRNGAS